jgi:NADH dehydrogenase
MRIAITGGTGFVGRHLARALTAQGHEVVLISRGVDARDTQIRSLEHATFAPVGISDPTALAEALAGCDAVAHCGGINREIGAQTYERVHVQGTQNVVDASRAAGVKKIILLSFIRARPDCGSAYHESKFTAEEIVRGCGLDFTVFKAGMVYGRGDHMLDHLSHALHSVPVFATVGFHERPIRPVAVEDLVRALCASLVEGRLSKQTVFVVGPRDMHLSDAVRQVARVIGRRVLVFPLPVWVHRTLAWGFERTMTIPLVSSAQIFMLSEPMNSPLPVCDALPDDLRPATDFTDEQIRTHLPESGAFGRRDFQCSTGGA